MTHPFEHVDRAGVLLCTLVCTLLCTTLSSLGCDRPAAAPPAAMAPAPAAQSTSSAMSTPSVWPDDVVVFDASGVATVRLVPLQRDDDVQWTVFDASGRQVMAVIDRAHELFLVERDRDDVSYVAKWTGNVAQLDIVDERGRFAAGLREAGATDAFRWRLLDDKGRSLVVVDDAGNLFTDDAMQRPLRVPLRLQPARPLHSGWLAVHTLPFEVRLLLLVAHGGASSAATSSRQRLSNAPSRAPD